MEEASQVRRAAREAVRDVDPERFRETIETVVEDGSMIPGVLAVLCARGADDTVEFDAVAERAAGTQLIYEGLRLTRSLAREVPWETNDEGADIDVLAADVLVARGFYLLARTEAAGMAVETVRNFGRDQTRHRTTEMVDHRLETDVFELAVQAGTTAVGVRPSSECHEFATDLARSFDGELPAAETLFSASVRESLRTLLTTQVASAEDSGRRDRPINRNG